MSKFLTFFLVVTLSNLSAQNLDFEQIGKIHQEILKLVEAPAPTFDTTVTAPEMDAKAISDLGFEQLYEPQMVKFVMMDSILLNAFHLTSNSNTTVILLHGILSNAYLMNKTAGLIREATQAEVYALDLRGHGLSGGSAGEVDYIGQYAEDVREVIKAVKKEKPKQQIILAGHSMGGGISLNVNLLEDDLVDGYLLFAPHLGENAPLNTSQPKTTYEFMKIHLNRTLGLKLLNAMGETKYNHLPVLFFNLPPNSPISKYSYSANQSIAPTDYVASLKKVKKSMLLLIGSKDEVFDAFAYKKAVEKFSEGTVQIITDETHNGIRHNAESMTAIKNWFLANDWQ